MDEHKKELEKSKFVTITLDDNSQVEAEVVFTFEENGDVFILYAIDDIVYPAKIGEDDSLINLENDEWEIVEKIFNEFMNDEEQ
ncbi:MAG: DUF1292 domain-containing protein [Mycoplasmataceae bacterium]|nr:DUF1292 domain-containing protein [Mycoplasmataceae bacterium]